MGEQFSYTLGLKSETLLFFQLKNTVFTLNLEYKLFVFIDTQSLINDQKWPFFTVFRNIPSNGC